ncbi:MAG: ATP-binding protein [Prolixibacteraceae bacterium]|jgi:signal transduction histidine kinase|nr:ATP-binding protein [Prolixibacteraceae bacterium]
MDTKFAPASRASIADIFISKSKLDLLPFINEIVCSLSYIFCIFNDQRQIVFVNDVLLKSLGIDDVDKILGRRFGEAFGCIHSTEEEGGCGTSEHCRYCGAIDSILQSKRRMEKTTEECRVRRLVNEKESSIELEVTSTPFLFEGEYFTIFSVIDITDRKRRGLIERIFFHDILNTAGSLSNIFELLGMVSEEEKAELLTIASSLSQQILDEITTQRLLLQAENSSLIVNNQRINSLEFLELVEKDLKYHDVATDKEIVLDESSEAVNFVSDPVILRKIINNMVKNALEATLPGGTISLKVKRSGDKLKISVHNDTFMGQEIESQIFMRSFSTKGTQRGLGTYSMKILGEQYLGGKVNFTTDPTDGTTFFIDIGNIETN